MRNKLRRLRRAAGKYLFLSRDTRYLAVFELESSSLGVVFSSSGRIEHRHFEAGAQAAEIASWGRRSKASWAMVFSSGDFSELELEGINDPGELAAAATDEIARLTGQDESTLCASAIRPDSCSGRHGVLAQTFKVEEVRRWASACRQARLRFLGMAGIYQLLPLLTDDGRGWVMMQRYSGSAGVLDNGRLNLRQLPFGLPGPKLGEDAWLTRCRQRLGQFEGRPVSFVSIFPETNQAAELFARELSCELEVVSFEGLASRLCRGVLKLISSRGLSMALPPPRTRDPREAGTMICLILIGGTITMLVLQHYQLAATKTSLKQILDRGMDHKRTLEAQERMVSRLREEVDRYRFQHQALTERKPVREPFADVLKLLSRRQLRHTRLEMVRQEKDGIRITGESLSQEELADFLHRLSGELHHLNLHLSSEQLSGSAIGMINFRVRISGSGK